MELAIMNKSWHNNDNIMNSEAVSQPAPLYRRILWSMLFRVLFGLGVPAAALAGLWFLYRFGNPFPCVFHKLTGLYCPGCGAGRALSALLHLHLVDAIDYNVFFVMALPLAAYYLLKKYIVLVFHRDPLPIFSTSLRTYNIVMLVILGFWILRNIPVFPFTLLAP